MSIFNFLLLSCGSPLSILDTSHLLNICIMNISHSPEHFYFHSDEVQFIFFFFHFMTSAFYFLLKKFLLTKCHEDVCLLSSRCIIILVFIFKFMIHLRLTFLFGVRQIYKYIFICRGVFVFHMNTLIFQNNLLKIVAMLLYF